MLHLFCMAPSRAAFANCFRELQRVVVQMRATPSECMLFSGLHQRPPPLPPPLPPLPPPLLIAGRRAMLTDSFVPDWFLNGAPSYHLTADCAVSTSSYETVASPLGRPVRLSL